MKYAVISDIHSNFEALKEVLKDAEAQGAERIVCLGDLVGYAAEPNEVITLLREKKIPCIQGNHDMAAFYNPEINLFNDAAKEAMRLTRKILTQESKNFLKNLPKSFSENDLLFVHGTPPNSNVLYISDFLPEQLIELFKLFLEKVCFVGHTHYLHRYEFDLKKEKILRKELQKGIIKLNKECKHIINVGSVGQPRDGNNKAKYVLFDLEKFELETRLVSYNIKKTVDKIRELGFPIANAKRLW